MWSRIKTLPFYLLFLLSPLTWAWGLAYVFGLDREFAEYADESFDIWMIV